MFRRHHLTYVTVEVCNVVNVQAVIMLLFSLVGGYQLTRELIASVFMVDGITKLVRTSYAFGGV